MGQIGIACICGLALWMAPLAVAESPKKALRPVKVLQPKKYLKVGKVEVGPHLGWVTNDPFIHRYMIGGNVAYHITEIFSVEVGGTFSPDFGKGDWKDLTERMIELNGVSPDISKILWSTGATVQFAPFFGKVAAKGHPIHFDLYGTFGFAVTGTADDLDAIGCPERPECTDTQKQIHPTTILGGGVRIRPSRNWALRFDGRSLIYIETVQSTTLEMKNNFILTGGATFFFGSKHRT